MSAAPPVTRVFVYGSLRPGSTNPHATFLSFRCPSLGRAKIRGRLFRNGLQFAAVHEPNGHKEVTGDVLVLPELHAGDIIESLDRYEGIGAGMPGPPAFHRRLIPVTLAGGEMLVCWAWLFALSIAGLPEVRSGDCLM